DVNGDGLDDLIYSNSSGEIFVRLNTTPTGGAVQFGAPIDVGSVTSIFPGFTLQNVMGALPSNRKFDFTGDGQADLLTLWAVNTPQGPIYTWTGLHFTGSAFTIVGAGAYGQPGFVVDVGDYNDDGCMDVLYSSQLSLSA